jgi:hypothetical protein
MLKKGIEDGYVGPAYFQPRWSPPVFQRVQPASQPIDDPAVGITPCPQINTTTPDFSSDAQLIQSHNVRDAPKNSTIIVLIIQTYSAQSNV